MRKVILYIAVSLDGYIADGKGAIDWISGQDESVELEDTFEGVSKLKCPFEKL